MAAYRMRRIGAALAAAVLLAGCRAAETEALSPEEAAPAETAEQETLSLPRAMELALLDQLELRVLGPWDGMDLGCLRLSDCTEGDTADLSPAQFAVVDLDGDGAPEVVYQRSDYRGFWVLRYVQGQVWAYNVVYRGLMELKQDGSFRGSGGSDNGEIGWRCFLGPVCDTAVLAQYTGTYAADLPGNTLWTVTDDSLASEQMDQTGFEDFLNGFSQKPDVVWRLSTEESVQQWLAQDLEALDAPDFPEPTEAQLWLDSLADLASSDTAGGVRPYNDGWEQAMEESYQLCLERLPEQAEALAADQAQWLARRDALLEQTDPPGTAEESETRGELARQRVYHLTALAWGLSVPQL